MLAAVAAGLSASAAGFGAVSACTASGKTHTEHHMAPRKRRANLIAPDRMQHIRYVKNEFAPTAPQIPVLEPHTADPTPPLKHLRQRLGDRRHIRFAPRPE